MHLLLFSAFAVCALGTLSVAVTEDLNIPLFYGWYYWYYLWQWTFWGLQR